MIVAAAFVETAVVLSLCVLLQAGSFAELV